MSRRKKIVIGLVGESGSGKDTAADYLKHRYGAVLLRFSDPIKELLHMFFDQPSREDQAWIGAEFKKRFGKDIFIRAVERKMHATDGDLFSVNGLRYPEDAKFVRSFPGSVLLYVTADQKLRWERSLHRGEKSDDNIDFEAFRKLEASLETEQSIPSIGAKADFTVENSGSLNDLFQKIDRIMDEVLGKGT